MLKPGGRIAYYNIFIAEELAEDVRRRVGKAASPGVYTRAQQRGLLRSAGFVRIEETDVTDEYLRTQRALYEANARHARTLRKIQGEELFEQRQTDREKALRGIELGFLRRALFVAERPGART